MDAILKEIRPLFFSPLVVVEVANGPGLNRQLLAEVATMRAASPGVSVSNQNGWHSPLDFFEGREPGCAALAGLIADAVRQATAAVSPGFDFAAAMQHEGWINVRGKGAYDTLHDHPGWAWSGTYNVQVPDGHRSSFDDRLLELVNRPRAVPEQATLAKHRTRPVTRRVLTAR